MLIETHELLSKLKKEIPFKTTITLSLDDDDLVIQVLFKKYTVPYFYLVPYKLTLLKTQKEETIITEFVQEIRNFYNNAENEELEEKELLNQTVNWRGEKNDRTKC